MDSIAHLARRTTELATDELTPTMVGLLIALLCLVLLGLACIAALLLLRRVRKRRASSASSVLPTHHTSPSTAHLRSPSAMSGRGHRRTLTITSTPYGAQPTVSYHDRERAEFMGEKGLQGPGSPVPEIHITFPEDGSVQKRGSRVVVVQITDNGNVGLQPYEEEEKKGEQLPRYEREEKRGEEWRSLDLERMGGLKEKDEKRWG